MFTLLLIAAVLVAAAHAATVTVAIGTNELPKRLVVSPRDTLHFVNIDADRVHRISARKLPGFDSHDLYPASYPASAGVRERDFRYSLNGVAPGEYRYFDEYTRSMSGTIVVVEYGCPWDNHPSYNGPPANAGPTRVIGARVAPTRNNAANEITPASQHAVVVEVALVGAGSASLKAFLRSDTTVVGGECNSDEGGVRDVDGALNDVESFVIDARSLPDGELMFELQIDDELYHVAGPVVKKTAGLAFDASAVKSIVNINLSQ
eukprot:TRINITY_DN190_c0_g1_i2.p2 TRINITY_DN190_c0_g1~~TRINITY_DN190_c0_g1_i2.p2  ORF type:complete len:278 (-),score=137.09 TRINITY_DN190_c0_g1_i2:85-873(-)